MGFCFLGGRENPLRKAISDKLTALGQAVNMGAMASAFTTAIQNIYDNRYTAGQDSLKTNRKLTLTSSQTGSNVDITDNWYTSVDASEVYTAGQNSLKVDRKLTLPAAATGTNYNITDNWYTTVDASAVYTAGTNQGKTDTISNSEVIDSGNIEAGNFKTISTSRAAWVVVQGVSYNSRGIYKRVGSTVTTTVEVYTGCSATASSITITNNNSGGYAANYWVIGL